MKAQPLFPVVVKSDGFTPPDAPTYFVIAGNGFFLERRTDLYAASVPVYGGVPGLESHAARLELRLPRPLPRALVETALGYFRAVFQRWHGEAILILFYAPAEGPRPARYRFVAPPQRIYGRTEWGRFRAEMHLEYGHSERPAGAWRKLGTMHSHGAFPARQSATDEHDEGWETGLHITAGYVNTPMPEFEAAFVVGTTRFAVPASQVLEAPEVARSFPKSWMKQITVIEKRWEKHRHDGQRHHPH
jgi:hypothetical protein